MLKVVINKRKLKKWRDLAQIGGKNFVFSGTHVLYLIEQLEGLVNFVEKFILFDRWVRSDFDRNEAYARQYFILLDDAQEALKKIDILNRDGEAKKTVKGE